MTGKTGQCLCGAIKFELASDPAMSIVCHCKNCQRQAGSAFSTISGLPKDDLKFTQGEVKTYEDSSSESGEGPVFRHFCGNCGSPIYSETPGQPGMVFLKTGTLDDTSGFTAMAHIWCDSKQDWFEVPEGMPQVGRQ